ncbi:MULTISPECIES: S8 family serine peptidase [unclassified Pseudoalteromonas]|uniref:S8 family serine peptidase n=1 Tax=unclassified Pseudoalteromonas TaxID=194690 RepID=UPI002096A901|nr:S8 family serine peptidase [Pseudoalteromonas sp. XMcav2-N]MCO7190532.1 S8 family serine peptidase [Pseudoalteromonas sp. XMcav2-N]
MKTKVITSVKYSLLALSVTAALSTAQAAETQRVIVTVKDSAVANTLPMRVSGAELSQFKAQGLASIATQANVEAIETLPSVNAVVMELTAEQLAELEASGNVESVEVDPKRFLPEVSSQSVSPYAESVPYGITMVQANQVSDSSAGNKKVCIMDTGYTRGHPDLPNTGVTGNDGHGSYNTGNWYQDGNGHGTHVAGTIAALGGNGQGVVGVNPSGQLGLHIVKVFNDQGRWAYGSDLIKAIEQCEAAGANVTSMSLGGSGSSTAERNAFAQSAQRGMLHIAAAGNGSNSSFSYPASYDAVVSVAAVDSSERVASFSQYNSQVEIAGPGVNVNSTWNDNSYKSISGTSMATPHVSGVAALVWSNFPSCSADQIRSALNATAKDKGAAGRDNYYGHGIVQAKAAYDYLTNGNCSGPGLIADFSATPNGLSVQFSNKSSAGSYSWSFGDGNSSSQTSPGHTYAQAGTYNVTLTVTGTNNKTATKSLSVTVTDGSNGGGCSGVEAWNSGTYYNTGDKVSYKGYEYQATWWSLGARPDIFSNVWRKGAQCK